jgi:hypothetical protein
LIFGGSATAFSAFKVSAQNAYFRANGKRTPRGMSFEWKLEGHIWNDPEISLFVRLRILVANGTFCLLFAVVGKK